MGLLRKWARNASASNGLARKNIVFAAEGILVTASAAILPTAILRREIFIATSFLEMNYSDLTMAITLL
jgi:hypothetical protein